MCTVHFDREQKNKRRNEQHFFTTVRLLSTCASLNRKKHAHVMLRAYTGKENEKKAQSNNSQMMSDASHLDILDYLLSSWGRVFDVIVYFACCLGFFLPRRRSVISSFVCFACFPLCSIPRKYLSSLVFALLAEHTQQYTDTHVTLFMPLKRF